MSCKYNVYAMKRVYLTVCLVIVAITTASASSNMMKATDSLEFIGAGGGGTGGVEVSLPTIYKFLCSIFSARNSSLSPCNPTSEWLISPSPTTTPVSILTASSTPSRALILFRYPDRPGITQRCSFFLTDEDAAGRLNCKQYLFRK